MSSAAESIAFRGTYADWKLVKTRGVVQVVIEIPLAEADAAYDVLGGMPNPAKEQWFAVAALSSQQGSNPVSERPRPVEDKQQAGGKRDWRDMKPSQQAALRCIYIPFRVFLREERAEDWRESAGYKYGDQVTTDADRAAECVRLICGVSSRSLLDVDHRARVIWKQLDDQFQAWERVGA